MAVLPASLLLLPVLALLVPPGSSGSAGGWSQMAHTYSEHVERTEQGDSTLKTIGGNRAKPQHFPHHVYIRIQNDTSRNYCSGAIVESNFIVVAAHCIKGMQVTEVVAGVVNLADSKDRVVRQVTHQDFYPRQSNEDIVNDIALLQVEPAFPDGYPGIQPIAVRKISGQPTGNCVISGWVRAAHSKYAHVETVKARLWPDIICKEVHPAQKVDTVCAGHALDNANNCVADSGSVLVCNGRLTGVASIAIPCRTPGTPQSFTEVSYYVDWLDRAMHNVDAAFDSGSGDSESDSED